MFARQVAYSDWLANHMLIKKSNDKYHMCINIKYINQAYPKDCYSLPNVNKLIDSMTSFEYLSFLDAMSSYKQIPMDRDDEEKTSFISKNGTYCYLVMPFGLKNVGATYQ